MARKVKNYAEDTGHLFNCRLPSGGYRECRTGEHDPSMGELMYRVEGQWEENDSEGLWCMIEVNDAAVADSLFRIIAAKAYATRIIDVEIVHGGGYAHGGRTIKAPLPDLRSFLESTAPAICVSGVTPIRLSDEAARRLESQRRTEKARARAQGISARGEPVRYSPARRSEKNPRAISASQRTKVMERDGFRCRRCGAGPDVERLAVDHILAVALGGDARDENLQTLCYTCNMGKGARNPHAHDMAGVAAK